MEKKSEHKINTQVISMVFAKRLKDVLKKMKISQSLFSELTGIPTSSLGRYVNGKTLPDLYSVIRIAIILNISLDYLLGFSDKPRVLHHVKKGRPMGRNINSISTFVDASHIIENSKEHINSK